MKRKKLWISLIALALLAPTAVLCFLVLNTEEFSLHDFADCPSLSLTDETGESVILQAKEEKFQLISRILLLAESEGTVRADAEPTWLYTVKSGDGKHSCHLGLDRGETAVLWKKNVYVLTFPHLQSGQNVMHPCLVRYGIEADGVYLDAPLLSQRTDTVYSFEAKESLADLHFDAACEAVSLDIFLYAKDAQEPSAVFHSFADVTFDPSDVWTLVVNAEVTMKGYRVQCGYELIYAGH